MLEIDRWKIKFLLVNGLTLSGKILAMYCVNVKWCWNDTHTFMITGYNGYHTFRLATIEVTPFGKRVTYCICLNVPGSQTGETLSKLKCIFMFLLAGCLSHLLFLLYCFWYNTVYWCIIFVWYCKEIIIFEEQCCIV